MFVIYSGDGANGDDVREGDSTECVAEQLDHISLNQLTMAPVVDKSSYTSHAIVSLSVCVKLSEIYRKARVTLSHSV